MLRRNRKGAKSQELWAWEVQDFRNMKGPLALQEYLQELIRNDPSNIERIITLPIGVQLPSFMYEQAKQFILQINLLVTQLRSICTRNSCPKMKSDQGVFLCASHKVATQCSAMDYMIHNLDHGTSVLHNQKIFSSKVNFSPQAIKHLEMIFRRLLRIFAHTRHSHTDIFIEFEQQMKLCLRFQEFCSKYKILPDKILNIDC